ncbi:MAG: hypothetical protein ACLP9K_09285 [Nitrososphaerales archaeon]
MKAVEMLALLCIWYWITVTFENAPIAKYSKKPDGMGKGSRHWDGEETPSGSDECGEPEDTLASMAGISSNMNQRTSRFLRFIGVPAQSREEEEGCIYGKSNGYHVPSVSRERFEV